MAEVKGAKEKEEAKELVPLTEEEQQIKKWFDRMKMYPVPLPSPVKYMAARMAVHYGLDPFLGEMVFIPQYKGGELVGYQPYVGIGGVRRAARRTGEYGGRELRPCTDEERKALQVAKDAHAWHCQVWRNGYEKPFDGFGIFPMHDKDKSKAPPWRMARKRAEHAALRAAFDLELQLMEANGFVVDERPIEAEVAVVEEPISEEETPLEGIPSEEAVGTPTLSIEEPAVNEAKELDEALWAYAKANGIASGIVQAFLEESGGAVGEALARLKQNYGEVE